MLVEKVREQLQEALRGGDATVVSTLRMLVSALEYKRSQKQGDFSAEDELAVVRSEAKKRQEAIEIYEKAGQTERVTNEKAELEILNTFLPVQASEEEVMKVIGELKDNAPGKGQLIGMVIGKMGKDRVDGTMVARLVSQALND